MHLPYFEVELSIQSLRDCKYQNMKKYGRYLENFILIQNTGILVYFFKSYSG
jgi:hypothetical protein